MNTEPERIATTDVLEISAHSSGCLGGGQWCQLTAQRPGPPSGLSNGVRPQQSCPHQRKGTTTKRQQRGQRRQEGEGAQGRGPTSNRRLRPAWSTCQTVRGRAPGARRLAREGNSLNGKPTVEKGCEWKAEERREGGTPWTRRGLACSFSLARRRGVQREEIRVSFSPKHAQGTRPRFSRTLQRTAGQSAIWPDGITETGSPPPPQSHLLVLLKGRPLGGRASAVSLWVVRCRHELGMCVLNCSHEGSRPKPRGLQMDTKGSPRPHHPHPREVEKSKCQPPQMYGQESGVLLLRY